MTDSGSSPTTPPHAPTPAAKPMGVREFDRAASRDLAAIARGEGVEAVVHDEIAQEEPVVEIDDFCLFYGGYQALHGVSMKIPRGKVTALIGPSGCGKSTLLRSVNRLNDLIDGVRISGDMRLNGDSIYGRDVDVIELRKRMGMVFQKSNPFPMSIYENVVYALRIDGRARSPRARRGVRAFTPSRRPVGRGEGPPARERAWACRAASSSGSASPAPSRRSPRSF